MKYNLNLARFFTMVLVILLCFGIFISGNHANASAIPMVNSGQIQEMMKLNSELKQEGYYTGEFEFKLLGIAYYLDRGDTLAASYKLNQFYQQLKDRQGLIKIPKFATKAEELEFYLNLQNLKTGAFMDDSYPLFTYIGPTLNMLEHLELLAKEAGQPLRLKYPLNFLDQINSGEELKIFLTDLSMVGRIGAKLPKTPYIAATELVDYDEIERNHLYVFSPEWKKALLEWYYENQDSKTGFWGPKLRDNGELLGGGELGSSYHIAKLFVDNQGNDLYSEFPLRYKEEMFASVLHMLSEPMPENLAEQHDWSLTRGQGIKMLTNFLWKDATGQNKSSAERIIAGIMYNRFEKFYIPDQGAFSLYSGSIGPDLDGTGCALDLLEATGSLSKDKQKSLWGISEQNIADLGTYKISALHLNDFVLLREFPGVNSIRLYQTEKLDDAGAVGIVYPRETPVLDTLDLLPRIQNWAFKLPQGMGIWVSKESILKQLKVVSLEKAVPVFKSEIPLKLMNETLQKQRVLVIVGLDVLQIPRCKMTFLLEKD